MTSTINKLGQSLSERSCDKIYFVIPKTKHDLIMFGKGVNHLFGL